MHVGDELLILSSGATQHFTHDFSRLTDYAECIGNVLCGTQHVRHLEHMLVYFSRSISGVVEGGGVVRVKLKVAQTSGLSHHLSVCFRGNGCRRWKHTHWQPRANIDQIQGKRAKNIRTLCGPVNRHVRLTP